ncbi:MAG: enoyl-CoA hydratase [Candidatus Tectimicrobiota bacterium]|nr:MAG: enoyl-CoA hydratase [Candidatus Tectomicrobia bacterium]
MAYEKIQLEVRDAIATITLNRPEAFNALDLQLAREFHHAVVTCSEDDSVRVVVITGSGRAFCAGGDVKDFCKHIDAIGAHVKLLTAEMHAAVSRLVRMPKPTISAVNGVAAGGGMALALAGDLVLAAESARFTMAYTQIGASPDGSSTFFLPRLIGLKRALELTYLNPVLSARDALAWGLVNRVFADDQFAQEVRAIATQLAQGPTVAYGHAKRLLYGSSSETLETQMELEAQAIAACGRTADFREGVFAFAEKRRPTFQGR